MCKSEMGTKRAVSPVWMSDKLIDCMNNRSFLMSSSVESTALQHVLELI